MLKKIIVAASVAAMLVVSMGSAQADNTDEVILGIMGGVIGGLIIGEAIEDGHRHHYPRRKVHRDAYITGHGVRTVCDTMYIDAYDRDLEMFIRVPKRECWKERY